MVLSVESCDDPTGCGTWIGKLANCEIPVSAVKTALHPVYVACNVNITDTVLWCLPVVWRTCGDIQATFASVMNNVAENTKMAMWAGPTGGPLNGGHWNDAE